MTSKPQKLISSARRVVVKVGSSSVSGANVHQVDALIDFLAASHAQFNEIVLVSSGAIANGLPLLNLGERPADLATQQAAAAVGQNALMVRYQQSLSRFGITGAQILLTASDIDGQTTRSNAKRAMERLLELRVLPIVNENDTVATHEIRFGDNDRLAALVAVLV
ncbi:MAG: glutamate 5-kinase, partial [Microbacteriaceae bacterium]